MKRIRRRILPWSLLAAVTLAAVGALAPRAAEENVEGGRLSRACRLGLWLVTHQHTLSGGALMWFGC